MTKHHDGSTPYRPLLFVCGGNTSHSPMAAAIARAELESGGGTVEWPIDCAGVAVDSPGAPITPEAITALLEMGVDVPLDHQSRQLTADMCEETSMVYCMTRAQRDSVVELAPDAAERTVCLDPHADVAEPAGQSHEAYCDCVTLLRMLIRTRLHEHRTSLFRTESVRIASPRSVDRRTAAGHGSGPARDGAALLASSCAGRATLNSPRCGRETLALTEPYDIRFDSAALSGSRR